MGRAAESKYNAKVLNKAKGGGVMKSFLEWISDEDCHELDNQAKLIAKQLAGSHGAEMERGEATLRYSNKFGFDSEVVVHPDCDNGVILYTVKHRLSPNMLDNEFKEILKSKELVGFKMGRDSLGYNIMTKRFNNKEEVDLNIAGTFSSDTRPSYPAY